MLGWVQYVDLKVHLSASKYIKTIIDVIDLISNKTGKQGGTYRTASPLFLK